jgi:hypothetical protein
MIEKDILVCLDKLWGNGKRDKNPTSFENPFALMELQYCRLKDPFGYQGIYL